MDARLQSIIDNYDAMHIGVDEPFKFHCTMCGKCCINREDILLTPRDVYNMSKELGMATKDFFIQYCETYIGSSSRMPIVRLKPRGSIKRCPLLKDRKCVVHNAKPGVCAMFPIGRCIKIEGDRDKGTQKIGDTEYIFTNPGCGDDSETHTVREWLNEFGIPLVDPFFLKWNNTISELGSIFHRAEKKVSEELMEMVWKLTLVKLYLEYDMSKDFMLQFESASDELITVMRAMPIPKGGK